MTKTCSNATFSKPEAPDFLAQTAGESGHGGHAADLMAFCFQVAFFPHGLICEERLPECKEIIKKL
ncbi:HhH-GPD base excision DNA repair family protein [Neisseria shayeganii 871]|uniref:HhH-GPD base excision DNA repair family protein n=1 Tax=Neisseria shayeganii 871 TaxID=1032488 RepID=G4CKW7_9NEIS|nr:HhH-GPD base excision DNA repair family protein [Neisseria shayeganii 871]